MREHMDNYRCALSTKFGDVELVATSKDHIYVSASSVTCNRVEVRFSLHLNDYGSGWEYARDTHSGKVSDQPGNLYHALYARRADGMYPAEVSFKTREKLASTVLEAVKEWAAAHPDALQEAQRRYDNNQLKDKEEKLAELREKMAELQKEIADLERSVKP